MSQILPVIFGLTSLLTGAGGVGAQAAAQERTRRAFAPGGKLGPVSNSGDLVFTPDMGFSGPNSEFLKRITQEQAPPAAYFAAEQNRANQESLRQQRGYAEETKATITGGALASANRRATELIETNAEAIPQATFDKLVAQFIEQNNAAARTTSEGISGAAARTGLSPDAEAAIRTRASTDNAIANRQGVRDLGVQRELANRDYTLQLLGLGGQVGQAYNQQFGAANSDIANTFQPPDIAAIGDIIQQMGLAEVGALNEQDQSMANALFGLSGSALDAFGAERQAAATRAAANRSVSPLGPILGFSSLGSNTLLGLGGLGAFG